MKPRSKTTSAGIGALQNSTMVLSLLLFLLSACTFVPVLKNGFINFDDPIYVTENVHVNQGLSCASFKWAFHGTDGGIWLPLTWISHMLDCQIYGLKPWGHHLTNVLIHAMSTALVFVWLFRVTGAKWRSFMVAALFGLHPLRVESVAWVAERKDVLSVMFWFLTLLAYTEYVKKSPTKHSIAKRFYALTFLFFIFGLMAKPMLVTLPFVLLLLDYWPLSRIQERKSVRKLIIEKWPFFVLSILASILAFFVQKSGVVLLGQLSFFDRIKNVIVSYVQYIGKTFWPENLCVYYPYPDYFSFGTVFASVVLLVIISAVFIWQWRRHPYLLVGWLWFLGTFMPVIGLVQVGKQAVADRYTYIPQVGLLLCLVWGAHALTKTWKRQSLILSATAIAIIIACMMLTCRQIGYWRDSETLFGHAIAVTKNNAVAHISLGNAFIQSGRIDDAIVQYQEASEINPNSAEAQNNLGNAFLQKGKVDEAVIHYQKALEVAPGYAQAHDDLGDVFLHKGNESAAIQQFQMALEIDPKDARSHIDLGIALYQSGRMDEAIVQYQMALEISPDDTKTHNNLGLALYQSGRTDEAAAQYQSALDIDPKNADAHINLGNFFLQAKQFDDAIIHYEKALEIDPNDAETHYALSLALSQLGRTDKAIASAQRALRLANEQNNSALATAIQWQLKFCQTNAVGSGDFR